MCHSGFVTMSLFTWSSKGPFLAVVDDGVLTALCATPPPRLSTVHSFSRPHSPILHDDVAINDAHISSILPKPCHLPLHLLSGRGTANQYLADCCPSLWSLHPVAHPTLVVRSGFRFPLAMTRTRNGIWNPTGTQPECVILARSGPERVPLKRPESGPEFQAYRNSGHSGLTSRLFKNIMPRS
jgi:hypothetical protein